jgi:ribonuclease HI
VGLEINPCKSAYTNNLSLIKKQSSVPANLPVQVTNDDGSISMDQITSISHDTPYKYMGVHLHADLNWDNQKLHLTGKFKKFQYALHNKKLTTDQKVLISNMVSNSYVAYSMATIHYDQKWLMDLNHCTAITINKAMGLHTHSNQKPLFLDPGQGGKGLVSLIDLQDSITCSQTATEMNSHTLSALTTQNTWYSAMHMEHTTNTHAKEVLQRNKLVIHTKNNDLNIIGNHKDFQELAAELLQHGYAKWMDITTSNMVSRFKLECCLGRSATNNEYTSLLSKACPLGTIRMKDSILKTTTPHTTKLLQMHHKLGAKEAETSLIHHPTNTIFAFTDGLCSNHKCGIGVYYGKNSPRNHSASACLTPTSTAAELVAIEEALKACPANYNLHIITDSKSAINIIQNYPTWPLPKQHKVIVRPTVLRILALRKQLANKHGLTISLTHIPSHINDKKAAAKREGPDAISKLELKIKALELLLPGKVEQYFEGNEKADKLARDGIDMPPVVAKWEIQEGSEHATIFYLDGTPVEGCARKHVLLTRQRARPGPSQATTNTLLTSRVQRSLKATTTSNFKPSTGHYLPKTRRTTCSGTGRTAHPQRPNLSQPTPNPYELKHANGSPNKPSTPTSSAQRVAPKKRKTTP